MARRTRIQREKKAQEDALVEELHAYLDLMDVVWSEEGYTFQEMASRSGLSPSTLHNLWHRKTRFPRFMTVQKLGKALGFEVNVNKTGRRIRIAA